MMELHDLIRGKAKQVSLSLPVQIRSNYSNVYEQRCIF